MNTPSSSSPAVKPTATRAGMPSERAITAYALANCTQNPRRSWRERLDRVGVVGRIDGDVVGEVAAPEVVAERRSPSRTACVRPRLTTTRRGFRADRRRQRLGELRVAPQFRRNRPHSSRPAAAAVIDARVRGSLGVDRVLEAPQRVATAHEGGGRVDDERRRVDPDRPVRRREPALAERVDAVVLAERAGGTVPGEVVTDLVGAFRAERPLPAATLCELVERDEAPVVGLRGADGEELDVVVGCCSFWPTSSSGGICVLYCGRRGRRRCWRGRGGLAVGAGQRRREHDTDQRAPRGPTPTAGRSQCARAGWADISHCAAGRAPPRSARRGTRPRRARTRRPGGCVLRRAERRRPDEHDERGRDRAERGVPPEREPVGDRREGPRREHGEEHRAVGHGRGRRRRPHDAASHG